MEIINRANDASVLMKLLLRELQLPAQTTHIKFVEGFSGLQKQAKEFELELRSLYEQQLTKQNTLANGAKVHTKINGFGHEENTVNADGS